MTIKINPPLQGDFPITQLFGENPADYARFGLAGHNGIDYGCPVGTPVYAAASGIVYLADDDPPGYGNYLIIEHDQHIMTLYAHLSYMAVHTGAKVDGGQFIGRSGSTGNSTGPHLHFELRLPDQKKNGYGGAVDPLPYLAGNQAPETTEKPVIAVGDIVQVVASDGLRVREKPTTNSETLWVTKPGRRFEVAKVVADGVNIWLGVVVYVAADYDGETLARPAI